MRILLCCAAMILMNACVSAQQLQEQATVDAMNTCAPLVGTENYKPCVAQNSAAYYSVYANQEIAKRQAMSNTMQQQQAYHQQHADQGLNQYPHPQKTQCQVRGQFIDCHSY